MSQTKHIYKPDIACRLSSSESLLYTSLFTECFIVSTHAMTNYHRAGG